MERLQDKIEYVFIDNKSHLYEQSIDLRYDEFYKNFNRTRESIFDEFEDKSIRIVACIDNKVIGNARLFIDEEKNAEITQVVVHKEYRGMNIGAEIMKKLLLYAKDNNVKKADLMQGYMLLISIIILVLNPKERFSRLKRQDYHI